MPSSDQAPRYSPVTATVILALSPFIVLTTAFVYLVPELERALSTTKTTLMVIDGLSVAGYAFGAMAGGDVVQRWSQRTLFLLFQGAFVVGSVVASLARSPVAFGAGRVLEGLATGLLLIVAIPPLVTRYGAGRMPLTAGVIDVAFFGAVTAGPLLGGPIAAAEGWRWLFAGLAAVGTGNLALGAAVLPHTDPANRALPLDRSALSLAFAAAVLPFLGAAWLSAVPFSSPAFVAPVAAGLAALVALLLTQYRKREPLSPVRAMSSTIPVSGTLVAAVAGGVFVSFLALAEQYLLQGVHRSPMAVGLSFWPMVAGAVVASAALAALVRTRFLPHLVLAGMLMLAAGGAVLLTTRTARPAPVLTAAGLLGLGAGATVSPGLWVAAFSLPSKMVGRTFALVELVRSIADFVLAPVILAIALTVAQSAHSAWAGARAGIWVTLAVTAIGTLAIVALYAAGGTRSEEPGLDEWLEGERPAIESPRVGAAVRTDAA